MDTAIQVAQRLPGIRRAGIEVPGNLLGLERLVKALQQPEMGRGTVMDAHMAVPPFIEIEEYITVVMRRLA